MENWCRWQRKQAPAAQLSEDNRTNSSIAWFMVNFSKDMLWHWPNPLSHPQIIFFWLSASDWNIFFECHPRINQPAMICSCIARGEAKGAIHLAMDFPGSDGSLTPFSYSKICLALFSNQKTWIFHGYFCIIPFPQDGKRFELQWGTWARNIRCVCSNSKHKNFSLQNLVDFTGIWHDIMGMWYYYYISLYDVFFLTHIFYMIYPGCDGMECNGM